MVGVQVGRLSTADFPSLAWEQLYRAAPEKDQPVIAHDRHGERIVLRIIAKVGQLVKAREHFPHLARHPSACGFCYDSNRDLGEC